MLRNVKIALCAACLSVTAWAQQGSATRVAAPAAGQPLFDPAAINEANQPEIANGAKGSGVLRAQILLDRAHFSCGQIDGDFGSNLQKTVAAFQKDRNLPVTGTVDEATWAALNQDNAPVL